MLEKECTTTQFYSPQRGSAFKLVALNNSGFVCSWNPYGNCPNGTDEYQPIS